MSWNLKYNLLPTYPWIATSTTVTLGIYADNAARCRALVADIKHKMEDARAGDDLKGALTTLLNRADLKPYVASTAAMNHSGEHGTRLNKTNQYSTEVLY